MFEVYGSISDSGGAYVNGVYIRQPGSNNFPVYIKGNSAMWVDARSTASSTAWNGGNLDDYKQKTYTHGRIWAQLETADSDCPEDIPRWREYNGKRWTSYDESRAKIKCLRHGNKFVK